MKYQKKLIWTAVAATALATGSLAQAASLEERVKTLEDQANATASAMEMRGGHKTGASKAHIGGYGEMHFNSIRTTNPNTVATKRELDFHRFVLFFGYDFTNSIRLVSELELEHSIAGEGKVGEVELEQAYIEFDLNDSHRAKAGLFLVPIGILNSTHEPETFYGVERNPIENKIIPTTWWEGGVGLSGEIAPGVGYDVALHSGLNTTVGNIRSGRQKVGNAVANDGAITAGVKYTGLAGHELALAVQSQSDIAQGAGTDEHGATLIELHGVHSFGPFGLRWLYAMWDIDGATIKTAGKDEQEGFYIEPSYRINDQWGVFARFNQWDNTGGDATDSEEEQINVGANFWPHENVVVKLDLEKYEMGSTLEKEAVNLGIGYSFH